MFPWLGVFEQVKAADVFVHYDDVQLPQGRSFCSRVQIKLSTGVHWLTIPVLRKSGQKIQDVIVDDGQPWREKHLETLRLAYRAAPFCDDAIAIVRSTYELRTKNLSEMTIFAIESVARYLGLPCRFVRSSSMMGRGVKDDRLLSLLKPLGATVYLTGQGALNYLCHERFDREGIEVRYLYYAKRHYPQLHGDFTPYVSVLDAIAILGPRTADLLVGASIHWCEAKRTATNDSED